MLTKFIVSEDEAFLIERLNQNSIVRISVNDMHLCIAFVNSKWVGFEEACPHLSISLAGGIITPFEEISCPWHGYRFNLFDGQETEQRCRNLKLYPVTVENGIVFIHLPK